MAQKDLKFLAPEVLEAIEAEARTYYQSDPACHRYDHVKRVERLALRLAEAEGADPLVVRLAAILHDIGRNEEKKTRGRVCHAQWGAREAAKILKKYCLDEKIIVAVCEAIAAHRFRNNKVPKTPEARCLYDADKLDALGAVGIGRAFLFAGEVGARLHNPEVDIDKTQPYGPEDTAWREFVVKLSRIKDSMLTKTGRRMAEERHRFMEEFFRRLTDEVEGRA